MRKLVALDTNHIKEYVFGTDKLKEIRGASSLLDYLNRIVMEELAKFDPSFEEKCIIFANGGAGLFLIDENLADDFGKQVQKAFGEVTADGSSITYVVQEPPPGVLQDIDELLRFPLKETLELMRYRLRMAKQIPAKTIAPASHPFMRPCDSCGVAYASPGNPEQGVRLDPGEENKLFCLSCQKKRERDVKVKAYIKDIEARRQEPFDEYLWVKLIRDLRENGYNVLPETERPHDFNVFRNFRGAKDYFGLIYADGNSMGKSIEACTTLGELHQFAKIIDDSIYEAVRIAITNHLQIEGHMRPGQKLVGAESDYVFPFDILLLGGDDVMMVVPGTVAMDVALTIATEFRRLTHEKVQAAGMQKQGNEEYTLSVGVVLAPVNYPFGLLYDLVESTLKFAKQAGTKAKNKAKRQQQVLSDETRINFMVVAGSTSNDFGKVYGSLHKDRDTQTGELTDEFYATLRPYDPEQLDFLLRAIQAGNRRNLGRTKLHQVREAVLKMNLSTSVSDCLAVLRSWKQRQRDYIVDHLYSFGGRYQLRRWDSRNPASQFPRVTFPWFADGKTKDGKGIYRTSLLDFIELYDFVSRQEDESGDES